MERHLAKALHRAQSRDRKRRPRMKVTGKNIFALQKLLRQKSK
jgi:hypothetical protein